MKVKIGKYRNWIGPYQIADIIFFWTENCPIDEKLLERWDYKLKEKFGTWLDNTWVRNFCEWIQSKRKRKVKVHIDRYDTWNMDTTLAYIIHPMLIQLKQTKHGSPYVDPEDAPHIGMGEDDGYGSDSLLHDRWDWVLDEMIWAFETINTDWEAKFYTPPEGKWSLENVGEFDFEGRKKVQDRMSNGFRLFGKYYQGLWD